MSDTTMTTPERGEPVPLLLTVREVAERLDEPVRLYEVRPHEEG